MNCLKYAFILLFPGLLLSACEKEIVDIGQIRHFSITSGFTDSEYELSVAMPVDFDPGKTYKTLYVLDGNWYFEHTAREADRISNELGKRNVLVVGIQVNDRKLDYTPTKTRQGNGGAAGFSNFLHFELVPYIEHRHPVDTSRSGRILLGHSLGGLFGAYAFTQHNNFWDNYLLLSPSLWYDEGVVLRYESENQNANAQNTNNVFLSSGEIENTQLFTDIFYNRIRNEYSDTRLSYHIIPRKNHSSSAKPAITEALYFYFEAN